MKFTFTDPSKILPDRVVTIAPYRITHLANEMRGQNRPTFRVYAEEPGVEVQLSELSALKRGVVLAFADGLISEDTAQIALQRGYHLVGAESLGKYYYVANTRVVGSSPKWGVSETFNGFVQAYPDKPVTDEAPIYAVDIPRVEAELRAWAATSPAKCLYALGAQARAMLIFDTDEHREAFIAQGQAEKQRLIAQ